VLLAAAAVVGSPVVDGEHPADGADSVIGEAVVAAAAARVVSRAAVDAAAPAGFQEAAAVVDADGVVAASAGVAAEDTKQSTGCVLDVFSASWSFSVFVWFSDGVKGCKVCIWVTGFPTTVFKFAMDRLCSVYVHAPLMPIAWCTITLSASAVSWDIDYMKQCLNRTQRTWAGYRTCLLACWLTPKRKCSPYFANSIYTESIFVILEDAAEQ
jgi:hypothetical protein